MHKTDEEGAWFADHAMLRHDQATPDAPWSAGEEAHSHSLVGARDRRTMYIRVLTYLPEFWSLVFKIINCLELFFFPPTCSSILEGLY